MTTPIFPMLAGEGWGNKQTPVWNTNVQEAVSGKETRVGQWSYPRYLFELNYEWLKSDPSAAEFQALKGFFNGCNGRAVTFLYSFAEDNSIAGQSIGTGDGNTKQFQMVRACGGFAEPVFAPDAVSSVKINGAVQDPATYSVGAFENATPGIITFTAAPGIGLSVTADFTFYYPCRFEDDTLEFEQFLHQLWKAGKVPFRSVK